MLKYAKVDCAAFDEGCEINLTLNKPFHVRITVAEKNLLEIGDQRELYHSNCVLWQSSNLPPQAPKMFERKTQWQGLWGPEVLESLN
jgi:hypothetical protein